MNPIAVLFAPGFEEAEALTIVDILRRANLPAETVGVTGHEITSGHGITLKTDKTLADISANTLEMAVIPGGYPGVDRLLESQETLDLLQEMNARGKWLAAICAGPRVLDRAGVIEGKKMTGYTGYAEKLPGAVFVEKAAVADRNLVTSQGPATGYPFAFKLAEVLGRDTAGLRERLLYDFAGGITA